jgi:predicted NACHT family NTPase
MATPRSLKLSPDGKRQVDRALTNKAWSAEDLADKIDVGRATAIKFRAGRQGVDRQNFVKFCVALGLDWQAVSDQQSSPLQNDEQDIKEILRLVKWLLSKLKHWLTTLRHQELQEDYEIEEETQEDRLKAQLKAQRESEKRNLVRLRQIEATARKHCHDKILNQYSKIRLLSGQEIGVDQLYVDVWLLDRAPRTFQCSADKMLETFDLRNDRVGLGNQIKRNDGFDVANQESKLLILGKPGAGKTTFLKHLAVDWCKGKFQTNLVALFIEFRQIRDEQWQLLDAIGEELKIQDREQVKVLLNDGKLLVLMDGFDEVPTQALRERVQRQLRQVVKNYSKNRYIMTCRTQIMADFNPDQVQQFVQNWFRANGQAEAMALIQWQNFKLETDKNPALQELTATPVLLGLMCLVLQDEGKIPAQAGLLYERGIRLLLRKWNDEKAINGWEIGTEAYHHLQVEQKEELLSEIAAKKFENPENFVLFEQSDLTSQISQHLKLSNQREARDVLKAIESQHGLLVERADELWSFSHLTLQEYFTTKWLLNLSLEALNEKIGNQRWQEVVQQLIKSQGQSDQLLRRIKQAIDYGVAEDDRLQEFLVWILEKAIATIAAPDLVKYSQISENFAWRSSDEHQLKGDCHSVLHKLAAIQRFYFELALGNAFDHYDFTDDHRDFAHDIALDTHLTYAIALDADLARARDAKDRHRYQPRTLVGYRIELTRLAKYRTRDLEFIQLLEQLEADLFEASNKKHFEQWWKDFGQDWREELRQAMIKYRNLGHDWQFTDNQRKLLHNCDTANGFLVELLKIENAASPEARQEIEDNLLLPIAELKRRRPDQYGGIEEG